MQETISHKFATLADAKYFALAGNAHLTLESLRTGTHFTYKVRLSKDGDVHFVSLLRNGSADEGEFTYLGIIRNGRFSLTKGSKAGADAPSVKAFSFFWNATEIHPALIVRHEGRCGKCGRTLTEPESIDSGLGPVCRAMVDS